MKSSTTAAGNNENPPPSPPNDGEEENDEEKVTSSMENIIPVKHISHGWKVLQGFAMVSDDPYLTNPIDYLCTLTFSLFLESMSCDDGES